MNVRTSANAACSVEDFVALWETHGSPQAIAMHLGVNVRKVYERRRRVEAELGIALVSKGPGSSPPLPKDKVIHRHHEGRIDLMIDNGTVIVFSDGHFWPNIRTTAHRALVALIKQIRPAAVVCNGDAFDGGAISRFPRIGWDHKPTVKDELGAVEAALSEIEAAARGARLIWTLGNHDSRYETRLAAKTPEFEGIVGFHLKDHFPLWSPAWTCWINEDTIVTHQYHNGIHATHNNVIKGHVSYVTGHLHSLKVTPYTNAKGENLYGVDTGTLADAMGPQFVDYMQGRHGNWRSGFAVLTYRDGKLLLPELVQKWDEDSVQFRGHILCADTMQII